LGGADIHGADFTNALLDKTQQIVRPRCEAYPTLLLRWLGLPNQRRDLHCGGAALSAVCASAGTLHAPPRARTILRWQSAVRAPLSPHVSRAPACVLLRPCASTQRASRVTRGAARRC